MKSNKRDVLKLGVDRTLKPFIVAAIPAYNEENTIARVVLQAQRHVDRIIVCDDGSGDLTADIAERLGADVVKHERNMGYGAALQSLFERARQLGADAVVTLDGDGQHDPNEIPTLVELVLEGKADIVIGSRFLGEAEKINNIPKYRRFGIKVITKLLNVASNYKVSDAQSGFRAYDRKALEVLSLFENGMGASVEVLTEAKKRGLVIVEVPMKCNYHELETSTSSSLKHGVSVLMSIVRLVVEERPLLFVGVPGVLSLMVGVLFGVWMLQLYIAEGRIVTNIALASLAFILIGFFTVSTGITLYALARLMQKTRTKRS